MPAPEPVLPNELDLLAYLEESGSFQFEMDVLRTCRDKMPHVAHGGTYVDPVLKKDRQYDIRAKHQKGNCCLKLAIECKHLKGTFPLLISRVPRESHESYHDAIFSGLARLGPGSHLNSAIVDCRRFPYSNSAFRPRELVGKAMDQVSKTLVKEKGEFRQQLAGSDKDVYERWSQAVSSAHEVVADSADDYRSVEGGVAISVVQPVLVVTDGTLWTVDYSKDGEMQGVPHLTNECTFYLGKTIDQGVAGREYSLSHLLIFTKVGLGTFLQKVTDPLDASMEWERFFDPGMISTFLAGMRVT